MSESDERYADQDSISRTQSVPAGGFATASSPVSIAKSQADATMIRSQSSVIDRPYKKPPTQHEEYMGRMRGHIQKQLKTATGASFEERSAAGAARMKKKQNCIELRQKDMLDQAVARAKARPTESPARPKHLEPESVESRTARGKLLLQQKGREYAATKADLLHRMATREPLFRVSEVQAAIEETKRQQAEYRQAMTDEEERRWAMIHGLKEKVLSRPMLVHDYRRPQHPTPDQVKVNAGEVTELDKKIERAMALSSYKESSWAQSVADIRSRADNRVPLHKIEYPPKKIADYKPRPKVLTDMDERLQKLIADPDYKNSEWARAVSDIQERQDNRTKLCDMTYPSKVQPKV